MDSNGSPVSGVHVLAWGGVHRVGLDADSQVTTMHTHSSVTTDSAGRFALGKLSPDRLKLNIDGEGWIRRSVKPQAAARELRVELERMHSIRVFHGDPKRADAYALLDAERTPLQLALASPEREQLFARRPLIGGRSGVVGVSERALECVLYLGG